MSTKSRNQREGHYGGTIRGKHFRTLRPLSLKRFTDPGTLYSSALHNRFQDKAALNTSFGRLGPPAVMAVYDKEIAQRVTQAARMSIRDLISPVVYAPVNIDKAWIDELLNVDLPEREQFFYGTFTVPEQVPAPEGLVVRPDSPIAPPKTGFKPRKIIPNWWDI